jgi:hypothetical protein
MFGISARGPVGEGSLLTESQGTLSDNAADPVAEELLKD